MCFSSLNHSVICVHDTLLRFLAQANGADTLRDLFSSSGVSEGIDALANATVFAPSEEALRALPESFVQELRADKEKLREFLVRGFNKERIKKDKKDIQIDFLLVIEDDVWKLAK